MGHFQLPLSMKGNERDATVRHSDRHLSSGFPDHLRDLSRTQTCSSSFSLVVKMVLTTTFAFRVGLHGRSSGSIVDAHTSRKCEDCFGNCWAFEMADIANLLKVNSADIARNPSLLKI